MSTTPHQKFNFYLFDLDGTLVDSLRDLQESINHVLTASGREALTAETVRTYVGDGVKVLLARSFLGKESPTSDDSRESAINGLLTRASELKNPTLGEGLAEFHRIYAENLVNHTTCYDGVREALQALKALDLPMGVVTNKPLAATEKILSSLEIRDFFATVVGGDTTEAVKPNSAPVRHALDTLRAEPASAIMIGDSGNDVLAGRGAGCATGAVTYGFTPREELLRFNPDHVLDRLAELLP